LSTEPIKLVDVESYPPPVISSSQEFDSSDVLPPKSPPGSGSTINRTMIDNRPGKELEHGTVNNDSRIMTEVSSPPPPPKPAPPKTPTGSPYVNARMEESDTPQTRQIRKSQSTTDTFYQSVSDLKKTIQWTWTVNGRAYEEGSLARIFYHRIIGEFNNTIKMLLETVTTPKNNCAVLVLHIFDRLLFLFDSMCDAQDTQSQEIFISLTRDIVLRLFELARYAAHDDHQHYEQAIARESQFMQVQVPQDQLHTYKQYMKFLQAVTHAEDIEFLRHAVLNSDSLHRAYILPMTSFCNIAKNTGRPFPAAALAMITVKVCRIVEISCGDEIAPPAGSTDRVLECCWDLFDSMIQGDLANRESSILKEVRIMPPRTTSRRMRTAASEREFQTPLPPPLAVVSSEANSSHALKSNDSSWCTIQ